MKPIYDKLKSLGFIFQDTPSSGSGYIMPDGKFMGMRENSHMFTDRPYQVKKLDIYLHPDLKFYLQQRDLLDIDKTKGDEENRVLMDSDNAIRICDGENFGYETAYVVLPNKQISYEQQKSLVDWLYHIMDLNKQRFVTFYLDHGSFVLKDFKQGKFYKYYFKKYDTPETFEAYFPEEIVKDIIRIFNQTHNI